MSQRLALVIGNSEYTDARLARLAAPSEDVNDLADVLRAPEIGGFDEVTTLVNASAPAVRRAVARLFTNKRPEDLLLLYFSGHGVRDDRGLLYLAVQDTEYDLLNATAIPAAFITDEMDRSRSRRQVLILDCCHSGAFAAGAKGAPGQSVGTGPAFQGTGYGRVVLTATDSTQFAWEGDRLIGEAENSVFTHYMLAGLRSGDADTDGDGRITLDELYDYVYAQVVQQTVKQTPRKFTYNQQGDMVLARNPRAVVRPASLPPELRQAVESPLAGVREGAVRELQSLLGSAHPGLALSARLALQRLADDDSRRVSRAAEAALAAFEAPPAAPSKDPAATPAPPVETPRAAATPEVGAAADVSTPAGAHAPTASQPRPQPDPITSATPGLRPVPPPQGAASFVSAPATPPPESATPAAGAAGASTPATAAPLPISFNLSLPAVLHGGAALGLLGLTWAVAWSLGGVLFDSVLALLYTLPEPDSDLAFYVAELLAEVVTHSLAALGLALAMPRFSGRSLPFGPGLGLVLAWGVAAVAGWLVYFSLYDTGDSEFLGGAVAGGLGAAALFVVLRPHAGRPHPLSARGLAIAAAWPAALLLTWVLGVPPNSSIGQFVLGGLAGVTAGALLYYPLRQPAAPAGFSAQAPARLSSVWRPPLLLAMAWWLLWGVGDRIYAEIDSSVQEQLIIAGVISGLIKYGVGSLVLALVLRLAGVRLRWPAVLALAAGWLGAAAVGTVAGFGLALATGENSPLALGSLLLGGLAGAATGVVVFYGSAARRRWPVAATAAGWAVAFLITGVLFANAYIGVDAAYWGAIAGLGSVPLFWIVAQRPRA